jgi:hypothetical protein
MTEKERRDAREAAFVRNLPDDRPYYVDGFPPIYPDSDSDADHVDIIKDMKAMGYFDDWD